MNNQFNELYKTYQEVMLKTFEETITELGWKIVQRSYKSEYSKDLATLELRINRKEYPDRGSVFFSNAWKEVLFIDRDEQPPRFDLQILNKKFGLAKSIRIAVERAIFLDASFRGDEEKVHALGKIMGRVRVTQPLEKDKSKEKIVIHYEKGIEQADIGAINDTEANDE